MEGSVLFNNALNTFYLWLYGVRHIVKDHSDSERGNPLFILSKYICNIYIWILTANKMNLLCARFQEKKLNVNIILIKKKK